MAGISYLTLILAGVIAILLVVMVMGVVYYMQASSSSTLINEAKFRHVDSSFTNGSAGGQVWPQDPPIPGTTQGVLATLGDLRAFLVFADWTRSTAMPNPTARMYFVLPESAVTVRTYIASQSGITYPTGYQANVLQGVLLSPTHLGFKFVPEAGAVVSERFFTGADIVVPGFQELTFAAIYATSA